MSPAKRGLSAFALALVLLLAAWAQALAAYAPGEVLVRFRPRTSTAAAAARHADLGARVAAYLPALRLQRLKLPKGLSVEEALRRYRQMPEVELVQPNYLYRAADRIPNDPGYGSQWHLPQIGAPEAWDTRTNALAVIVAVVDTGVDYNHEDFYWDASDATGNFWTNPDEIPGNDTDDDGDGYTDDYLGWDFVNGDNDPMDDYSGVYHGTHVAGIIGARGNNGLGGSGVCWRVRLMALKALNSDGQGYESDIVDAVNYAVQHGADVINLSLEADGVGPVMREAMDYAEQAGVLVVCAAGNDQADADKDPVYPGCLPNGNIINVASSGADDTLVISSNYGVTSVDVAAPGDWLWTLSAGNDYDDNLAGTSMAAAVVSGAAALLWAAHPELSCAQVRGYLILYCQEAGLPVVSAGRLDLAASLAAANAGLPWQVSVSSESGSGSGASHGGGCFIATAAYGSPLAPQVRLLRAVRDRWLLGSPAEPLVGLYYRLGPAPARFVRERGWLPPLVRAALLPTLPLARAGLEHPLGLLGGLVAALIWLSPRKRCPETFARRAGPW